MEIHTHFPPYLKKLIRRSQVVLPKDIGTVIAYTGIGKESVIAEAGTGSGFATIQFANICKKVYSFEIREDHYEFAKKNIEKSNMDNIELQNSSIDELTVPELDLIFLDLKDSHLMVSKLHNLIKEKGYMVGYVPNIEQAKDFTLECEKYFSKVFTITTQIVSYEVRDFGCRPDHFGMQHTAYLVFAEK